MSAVNRARFTINGQAIGDDVGFVATPGEMLTLTLEQNPSTTLSATYFVNDSGDPTSPHASLDAPHLAFVGGGTVALATSPNEEVQIEMPNDSDFHSYILRCVVSTLQGEESFERLVAIRSASAEIRKPVPGESTQFAQRGVADMLAEYAVALENSGGGGGGGGDADGLTTGALRDADFVAVANEVAPIDITALPFTATLPTGIPVDTRCGFLYVPLGSASGNFAIDGDGEQIAALYSSVELVANLKAALLVLRWSGYFWAVEGSQLDFETLRTPSLADPGFLVRDEDLSGQQAATLLPLAGDDAFPGRSGGGTLQQIGVSPNTIVGHSTRSFASGTGLQAYSPLDSAKIIASMTHWNSGDVTGNFTAEPNRAYHVRPGGAGILIDMANVADVPDGAEVLIYKNETGTDPVDIQPGDSSGFVVTNPSGSGSLAANVLFTTGLCVVKLKFSSHVNRWLVSGAL